MNSSILFFIALHTFIRADIRSVDDDIKCGCPTRRHPITTDASRIEIGCPNIAASASIVPISKQFIFNKS
jgi:hypothetical protein